MKSLSLFFLLFCLLILVIPDQNINAQPWFNQVSQKKGGNINFFEIQKSFNQFWESKNVVGGWYIDKNGNRRKAQGWKQFKRWESYWKNRVNSITGEFPDVNATTQYKNFLSTKKSLKASTQGNWTSEGPANIDLAGRGTGRINCITFHPSDNNTFWVGAPAGGLWKTTDHGASWTVLTDENQVLGISDICLATDFTTSNTIYIATGDKDGGSFSGQNGGQIHDNESVGVLKSNNGGLSWQSTGLSAQVKEHFIVSRIIAHPSNSTTLWAATNRGVYKSTDAGVTWSLKQSGAFIDMEMKPGDANTLYASTSVLGTPFPQIFRSLDSGESWTLIQTFTIDEFRCDLEVSPDDPSVVYAAISMSDYNGGYVDYGALHGIFKSTDSGASYTQVYDGTATNRNLFGWETDGSDAGGQGDYDLALAVNPSNADEVYIGGVNSHRSTNGAISFSAISCWTSSPFYNHNGAPVVHADHHMAKYRPSDGAIFDVNDGGVHYTTNSGASWTEITTGLVTGQLYGIAVAQNISDEVLGGFQDNGTKLKDNGTNDWIDVKGGDGMNCAIDITNDNNQYGTYAQGQIDRTTNKWSSSISINAGGSADWSAPLEIDPAGGSILYFGNEFVRYYDGSWHTLSTSLSPQADGYLQTLSVYHVDTDLYIYTGDKNQIWRSDNTGGSYTDITNNLPANTITDIEIKDDDPFTAWVTLGGYDGNRVYQTIDGGTSWVNISEGLPELPVMTIVQNNQNTTEVELYVGTDVGVFVKLGTAPWIEFSSGLPNVVMSDLDFYYDANPANSILYGATYGRGVWSTDPYQPATLDASISAINEPFSEYCEIGSYSADIRLANIGTTTLTSCDISYTLDGGSPVIYNWAGSLVQGATTDVSLGTIALTYGSHEFVVTVSNPNGGSDGNSINDSKNITYKVWNNSMPYTQNFDDFTLQSGGEGTSIILEQCWTNEPADGGIDWSVNTGGTASANTGPTTDHTSGSGNYLYTETSGISGALDAYLISPEFDLAMYENTSISFWYHMYGANMGTLSVQVSTDGGSVWSSDISVNWADGAATSVSGDKGGIWHEATADISSLVDGNSNVKIRFHAVTAVDFLGDMAIDDFSVNADIACTQPATQASSFSAIPDYTSIDISWTRGTGDNILVVAHEGSAVDSDPIFNTAYSADATFGSGNELGTGNYVVYNGTGTNVNITGLTQGTAYHFALYEYNNTDICYLLPELMGSGTTLVLAPNITATVPDNFYADLGKRLTIQGANFNNVSSVVLGGISGSVFSNDGETLVVDFPAGNYVDNTLTVTNSGGADNFTCAVNTRDIIPVGNGTDSHTTITSALNGLFAWWGTTAFDANKIIDVYSGTYTETITPDVNLSPAVGNMLVIQAHEDQSPIIDASGNANGVYIGNLDYVKIEGFTVYGADNENIYIQGSNCEISHNKVYNAGNSGIKIESGSSNNIHNNLTYNNKYGIHILNSDNNTVKNNTSEGNGTSVSPTEQTLLDEGFEGGSIPGGWTQYGTGPNNWTVGFFTGPIAGPDGSTNYAIHAWNASYINRALETSGTDLTGYALASLEYYVYHSGTWGDIIYTEISTDGGGVGGTWNTLMTHDQNHSGWSPLQNVDISAYVGNAINVRFRYEATDGNSGAVDVVKIKATATAVNDGAGLYVESGTGTTVENNIFVAKTGTGYLALKTEAGTSITTDYNTYYKDAGNTNLVNYLGTNYTDFTSWPNEGANDLESDPLFVNAATDFHLQSTFGSFQGGQWPPISAIGGTWTNDASFSPSIDAGNADAYDNEPSVNGSIINQGCYGNTQQASKTNASSGTNGMWTGATSTNWLVSGNWDDGNVPTELTNVVIDNVTNQPVINANALCNNLTINTGANLIIDAEGKLIVNGTLTNNVGTSGLTINSNENDDGALIYNNSGINATVQRFLDAPALNTQWHYLSSPITAAPVSLFGLNFYNYDESTDDWWTASTSYGNSGWNIPAGNLVPLAGYIYNSSETTINFLGELNYNGGDYIANVSYTEHAGDAANGDPYTDFDGWNLMGNPYPSELDWDAITKINVDATIYYYNDLTHNYAYYIDGIGSVNGGSRYIPSMQAFFVKANNVSGGTLTIPLSARTFTGQSFYKKSSENTSNNSMRLSVSDNGYNDESLIALSDNATLLFDNQLDAYKRFAWNEEIPQIFSLNSEKKSSYAINSLPTSAGQHIIPLGFKFKSQGSYVLHISELNIEGYHVFLEDLTLNKLVNLRETNEINIEYNEESSADRYQLNLLKNNPPIQALAIPDQQIAAGSNYEYTIPEDAFYDADLNDKISYNVKLSSGKFLPLWLTFNNQSLKFAGLPAEAQELEITIEAKDLLGATTSTTFKLVVSETTGIKLIEDTGSAICKVFPNPNKGNFNIKLDSKYSLIHYKIISLSGNIVKEAKIRNGVINPINIRGIKAGTYILNIILDNNLMINKSIVIED